MARSSKRSIGVLAWLVGIVLVVGGLVALFSLVQAERFAQHWPLGIRASEVQAYASLLDRRPVEAGHTRPDLFTIGGSSGKEGGLLQQTGTGWRKRWFETEGYGDSVDVRRLLDREGYLIRFKKDAPLNGQRRIMLLPATVEDMRAEYLEKLASGLGLLTPSVSFVRVIGGGAELGLFRREEWVDEDLLERRGLMHATLLKQGLDPTRPDLQFARIDGDSAERVILRGTIEQALAQARAGNTDGIAHLVDEKAAIAWLIMAWVDGHDLDSEDLLIAHQWSTGRMVPIYRVPRTLQVTTDTSGEPLAINLVTPMLQRPAFRALFEKRLAELVAQVPELREQFDALNKAWLPVIAEPEALPFAQTRAQQVQESLVQRINATGAIQWFDRPLYSGPGHDTFLHGMPMLDPVPTLDTDGFTAELAKRYKVVLQGDSIIFPRGKFTITEDLHFPADRRVILLQGARLFLAPGVDLLCQGDLHINGTLRNPVFIRPLGDAPFGTVAMVGNGSQQCRISGLLISGGSGATIDGVRHAGMVSVQGAGTVDVRASVFQGPVPDAALLVNGGGLVMERVRFSEGGRYLLQLDHVTGTLRDLDLAAADGGHLMNGLHLSASRVAIIGGRSTGFSGAAITADAASQVLVRNCRFEKNATAISALDLSMVHVQGNSFVENAVAIQAARGRTQSGSRVMLYPNEFIGTLREREIDAHSTVTAKDTPDETTLKLFGVQEKEPEVEVRRPRRRSTQ